MRSSYSVRRGARGRRSRGPGRRRRLRPRFSRPRRRARALLCVRRPKRSRRPAYGLSRVPP